VAIKKQPLVENWATGTAKQKPNAFPVCCTQIKTKVLQTTDSQACVASGKMLGIPEDDMDDDAFQRHFNTLKLQFVQELAVAQDDVTVQGKVVHVFKEKVLELSRRHDAAHEAYGQSTYLLSKNTAIHMWKHLYYIHCFPGLFNKPF
jgi:hypothetical protein